MVRGVGRYQSGEEEDEEMHSWGWERQNSLVLKVAAIFGQIPLDIVRFCRTTSVLIDLGQRNMEFSLTG